MARLTIPDEQTFAEFTVVTSTSAFPITFSLFAKADLTVLVDGTPLDQSAFTFTGTLLDGGGYDGGTVTLNTAVDDVTVRIERNVAPARTSNFAPAATTPVGSVDQALNRLTAVQQDIDRRMTIAEAPVAAVTAEGDVQDARIIAEGDTQEARVIAEGDVQDARIIAEGDTQEARVIAEGDTQDARVVAQGDTQNTRVTAQGTAQVALVAAAGDAEIAEIATRTGASQYASTADALSSGVWSVAITAAGTGGTTGTYTWSTTGGAGTNAAGYLTIAGGAITSVVVTHRGRGYTSAPTIVIAGTPAVTGHTLTASIAVNQPVGTFFSVKDGTGYATFENVAGVAIATNPTLPLPACVEAFYPCDEGGGTTLRDVVRGRTCTLTAIGGVGTIGWTKDGFLQTIGAGFVLPAMSHRAIAAVIQMPEGDDTSVRMLASSSGEYLARRQALAANITSMRCLDGWGITTPRIGSTVSGSSGTLMALEGGGWQFPSVVFPATRTGTAAIGADAPGPVQRLTTGKWACLVVYNTTPTAAEERQVLNYTRAMLVKRGIYLTHDDCPTKATMIALFGESTDDGRFEGLFTGTVSGGTTLTIAAVFRGVIAEGQEIVENGVATGALVLPYGTSGTTGTGGNGTYALDRAATNGTFTITTTGLTKASMDTVAESLFINAINSTAVQPFRRMSRFSTRPPYVNTSGVANGAAVTKTGWLVGLRDALAAWPHDGRQKHVLNLGVGSTYLLRAGNGTTTSSGDITKSSFTASIAGNVMTVTGTVTGAIMPTDVIVGTGVTANSQVAAFGTGGTTGTGGAGTYQLSQSSTVASSAMTGTKLNGLSTSASRSATSLFPHGINATIHERYLRRAEGQARNNGIGYTTFIAITSEGLNDGSLGDLAVPDAATYQALLQAWYDWLKQATGITNPTWIITKPHLPYGGVLGGPDVDYPNNQMGQSRLNAINFIRTACDAMATANPGSVFVIDGNLFDTNNGTDYVHYSAAGNVAYGKAVDALLRRVCRFTASASGTTLTVTGTPSAPVVAGMELEETMNLAYNPAGNAIKSQLTGTTGLAGTYELATALTIASIPMATVELYRKPIRAAA